MGYKSERESIRSCYSIIVYSIVLSLIITCCGKVDKHRGVSTQLKEWMNENNSFRNSDSKRNAFETYINNLPEEISDEEYINQFLEQDIYGPGYPEILNNDQDKSEIKKYLVEYLNKKLQNSDSNITEMNSLGNPTFYRHRYNIGTLPISIENISPDQDSELIAIQTPNNKQSPKFSYGYKENYKSLKQKYKDIKEEYIEFHKNNKYRHKYITDHGTEVEEGTPEGFEYHYLISLKKLRGKSLNTPAICLLSCIGYEHKGRTITVRNLFEYVLSARLYTSSDALQKEYRKTTYLPIEELTDSHKPNEFYHIHNGLEHLTSIWKKKIKMYVIDPVMNIFPDKKTVLYHGGHYKLSDNEGGQIYFGPLSLTTSFNVAQNFSNEGVVLQVGLSVTDALNLLPVSWISEYENEEEYLLFNSPINSLSIIDKPNTINPFISITSLYPIRAASEGLEKYGYINYNFNDKLQLSNSPEDHSNTANIINHIYDLKDKLNENEATYHVEMSPIMKELYRTDYTKFKEELLCYLTFSKKSIQDALVYAFGNFDRESKENTTSSNNFFINDRIKFTDPRPCQKLSNLINNNTSKSIDYYLNNYDQFLAAITTYESSTKAFFKVEKERLGNLLQIAEYIFEIFDRTLQDEKYYFINTMKAFRKIKDHDNNGSNIINYNKLYYQAITIEAILGEMYSIAPLLYDLEQNEVIFKRYGAHHILYFHAAMLSYLLDTSIREKDIESKDDPQYQIIINNMEKKVNAMISTEPLP